MFWCVYVYIYTGSLYIINMDIFVNSKKRRFLLDRWVRWCMCAVVLSKVYVAANEYLSVHAFEHIRFIFTKSAQKISQDETRVGVNLPHAAKHVSGTQVAAHGCVQGRRWGRRGECRWCVPISPWLSSIASWFIRRWFTQYLFLG